MVAYSIGPGIEKKFGAIVGPDGGTVKVGNDFPQFFRVLLEIDDAQVDPFHIIQHAEFRLKFPRSRFRAIVNIIITECGRFFPGCIVQAAVDHRRFSFNRADDIKGKFAGSGREGQSAGQAQDNEA